MNPQDQEKLKESKRLLEQQIIVERNFKEELELIKQNLKNENNGKSMYFLEQQKLEVSKKNTGIAYVLWLFLGGLGAHRHYIGDKKTAYIILIASVIGWCGLFMVMGDSAKTTVEILNGQTPHITNPTGALLSLILGVVFIYVMIDAFRIPNMIKKYNLNLIEKFHKEHQ